MEQEAEYVHPVTLPAEVVKRATRKPAWDAEELCIKCGKHPRTGDNCPFARGPQVADGTKRFQPNAERHYDVTMIEVPTRV